MNVLIFAPHNDDEVLGVGGTAAILAKKGHCVTVCEVTHSSFDDPLTLELRAQAAVAHEILGVKNTMFLDLPVVALKDVPVAELNAKIGAAVIETKPEIVFIPHEGDMHTDHFETARSALVALRPAVCPQLRAVLAYETLSETEWNAPSARYAFLPNVWVDISETMDKKLAAMECYTSQLREFPNPRSLEAMRSLAKYRGSTICREYAECFMLLRSIGGFEL